MGAAKACNSPYESARNQRLEENKKRLQELGLTELSKDLSKTATPTKSSPSPRPGRPRGSKEKVKVQLRRSTRNLDGPQPEYVEVEIDIRRRASFDNTGGTRHYSRLYERKHASDEARACATEKAEALKMGLGQTNASFVKPMLQSHVTGGFWLGLPVAFCRDHLPKKDDRIVLEDENNEEWETIYLAYKTGLSGGWRGFSLDHGLVDGDALVFELVQHRRFKVHIIRVYGSDETCEETQECEDVVKMQSPKSDEKVYSNKVRQRLIWKTEQEKGSAIKEETEHAEPKKRSDDYTTGFVNDSKPGIHLDMHSTTVKEELECDVGIEDVKNVDLLEIEARDDPHHRSFKRLKKNTGLDTLFAVKTEIETCNGDGFDDVKDVVRLFDSNSSNMHAKDITSYLRSRKHIEVNMKKEVKEEIQSEGNECKLPVSDVGVCAQRAPGWSQPTSVRC